MVVRMRNMGEELCYLIKHVKAPIEQPIEWKGGDGQACSEK